MSSGIFPWVENAVSKCQGAPHCDVTKCCKNHIDFNSSSESTVGWSSLCKLPTGLNPPTAYCSPGVILDDGCINKRIVRPEKPFDPKYSPKKCDWSSGQRWRLRWRHLIDRKVWRMHKVAFHCCARRVHACQVKWKEKFVGILTWSFRLSSLELLEKRSWSDF